MSSNRGKGTRAWLSVAIAFAAIIGTSGCVGQADSAHSDAAANQPEPTAGELGPTAAPELPVIEGESDEEIELDTQVAVTLDSITTTSVEAETPGDMAGEAVEIAVTVTNASSEPQSVDSAVVTLEADDGEHGIPTNAGGGSPLTGVLDPGDSASGSYLFILEPAADRDITVTVNYAAGEPVAQFTGHTP